MNTVFFGDLGPGRDAAAVQDAAMMAMCRQRPACPRCGIADTVRLGVRKVSMMDVPELGQPVSVTVEKQRWRCKGCSRVFFGKKFGCSSVRRMTVRLEAYIVRESQCRTNKSIAKEVGVTTKTVYHVLRDAAMRRPGAR